jgi:hypothetical protein
LLAVFRSHTDLALIGDFMPTRILRTLPVTTFKTFFLLYYFWSFHNKQTMSSSEAIRSNLQRGILTYLLLLPLLNPTLGFMSVLPHHKAFTRSTPFLAKGKNPDDEPLLTDLDSRVLQKMLQENDKLDLRQEANLKKLLERAVAPKTADPYMNIPTDDNDNGPYSSSLFKVSSSSEYNFDFVHWNTLLA